jgi:hypothetical protein
MEYFDTPFLSKVKKEVGFILAYLFSYSLFWASPHEDVWSLRYTTRYSLGPVGLPLYGLMLGHILIYIIY